MANVLYNKFKEILLKKGDTNAIDFTVDTIKVALIDTGTYTPSAAHQFLSSASAGVVGTAQTLASVTITSGVLDAADITFPTVSGASCEALLIYKDTGSAATSPLVCLIDTVSSGLPVTPNGGNINVVWNASGILAIG